MVLGEVWAGRAGRRRSIVAHAACRAGLDCRLGAGHGEEHTENIRYMVVTLEVSKFSGWLNAFAPCRVARGTYGAGRGCGPADGGDGVQRAVEARL